MGRGKIHLIISNPGLTEPIEKYDKSIFQCDLPKSSPLKVQVYWS